MRPRRDARRSWGRGRPQSVLASSLMNPSHRGCAGQTRSPGSIERSSIQPKLIGTNAGTSAGILTDGQRGCQGLGLIAQSSIFASRSDRNRASERILVSWNRDLRRSSREKREPEGRSMRLTIYDPGYPLSARRSHMARLAPLLARGERSAPPDLIGGSRVRGRCHILSAQRRCNGPTPRPSPRVRGGGEQAPCSYAIALPLSRERAGRDSASSLASDRLIHVLAR